MFGLATKKELKELNDKLKLSFKERDDKIEKLKEKIESNALKVATLEGSYLILANKSQSQVSVSKQSQAVSGKSQATFETKLIQRIRNNKKSLVMAEIMKLTPSHSTQEVFEIIVLEKGLCSKASFYRYISSLKSQFGETETETFETNVRLKHK